MTVLIPHITKGIAFITFSPRLQRAAVTGKRQGLRCSLGCLLSPPFRIERISGTVREVSQLHGGQNQSGQPSACSIYISCQD